MVREGWEEKKLVEVATIESGGTPSTKNEKYWKNGDIFWVTLPDQINKYIYNTQRKITDLGLKKSSAKLLPKNTVILSSRATIGEVSIIKKEMSTNQGSKNFICNPSKIYFEFLFYLLKANIKKIKHIASGATYKEINKAVLSNLEVEIPRNITEQKKIATIFSNYDDLIEANEKRIKILENIAKLIYEEWFVRFKFPGHEKVKVVDSGTEFGKIPEGWEVKSIMGYENFDFINTNIKKFEGEKEYFATANISGLEIIKEGEFVNYQNKPSRAQKEPILNSVWFARMKDSYKVLGFSKANEFIAKKSILSSGFAGFKCEENIFPFLFLNINSKKFETLKDLYATGATQVSINNDGIKRIEVISPKKEIVESFGQLLNPLLNKIFQLQIKNQNLRKTRDLLLPKLISGDVDVSELDIKLNEPMEMEVSA